MTRSKSPTPTVEPQAAGQPVVSIEVLEDRYTGLMTDRKQPLDHSRLQERLDELIGELFTGVARRDPYHEAHQPHGGNAVHAIHEDLRDSVMKHVMASGIAR